MFFIHLLLIADSDNYASLVLSDLRAAFGTVDHGILVSGLENCVGIKGTFSLEWFRSVIPRVWSWAPWWALRVLQVSHSKRRNSVSKYVQLHIYMHLCICLFIFFIKSE